MKIDDNPNFADILRRIGKQIELLRTKRTDYNFKQLAEQIDGISKNTYLRIERGSGSFSVINLLAILQYYPDVKLSDLLRDAGL